MDNHIWKAEVCKKESTNYKSIVNTSFKSEVDASNFFKRNEKKYKEVRKRVSCYNSDGTLLFTKFYWD